MIRQAHTYLVGALSGVVVIGIAIAAFVVLVSAQVFHDLPIPALSSSDQKAAAVSHGKALTGSPDRQVAITGGVGTGNAQPNRAIANAPRGGQNGANNPQPNATPRQTNDAAPTQEATSPAEVVETPAVNGLATDTGGNEGTTSPSGGNSGGSHNSQPSSKPSSPSSSGTPGSIGGGNPTTTSGGNSGGGGNSSSSGTSNGTPTTTSSSGSGSGTPATGTSSGGGTPTVELPATPVTTAKPSEAVTESVNGAVGTVNEATGGALEETGVKEVTEEVVKGVAGPESVVGETVDGVGEAVGGLVGGGGH